ncbi:hypothetical protein PR202_gn00859 [Eleusine coracana subsp. coracana]|uniref:Arf-GAP domain-containing protein n=1 Tax=Eleusine coracana subsp. coracana TaxID=191504 RepID=A0AAV5G3F7_ELECO|nr:hypothetical protein PR202_gn00859 [Eleusine coracana subsp. coracana]
MASRVKEDERNERIIRGLLKLPANKRCINCNNLGPQYVCTNFSTFVCTNCSGAHREFTHRVKSISMAKFTAQEVTALQEGGNERAREIFFKEWDAHRNAYPDSSNADKLRNFIKHVYVERRYTGERSTDRPPRGRDDKDEYSENRRSDGNWDQLIHQSQMETRAIDPPPQAKTVSATNNIASPEGPSEQTKVASAVSLIDFSEDPEPTVSAAPSQQAPTPRQHPVSAPASHPVNSPSVSGGDWASFDAFGQQQTQQSSSSASANPLESALAQLSFSETPPVPNSSANGQSSVVDQSQSLLFDASFWNIRQPGVNSNAYPRNFSSPTFSCCLYTGISFSYDCQSTRNQWYSRGSIFY